MTTELEFLNRMEKLKEAYKKYENETPVINLDILNKDTVLFKMELSRRGLKDEVQENKVRLTEEILKMDECKFNLENAEKFGLKYDTIHWELL